MEINGENYTISYDPDTAVINCKGSLRLYGATGYAEIVELLNRAVDRGPEILTLDIRELQFLNSSGINTLSKFVIRARNKKISKMSVLGASKHPWQMKSLKNLQRLMPNLNLDIA